MTCFDAVFFDGMVKLTTAYFVYVCLFASAYQIIKHYFPSGEKLK